MAVCAPMPLLVLLALGGGVGGWCCGCGCLCRDGLAFSSDASDAAADEGRKRRLNPATDILSSCTVRVASSWRTLRSA